MDVAHAAFAAFGQAHALAVGGEVGHGFFGVDIAYQRAHGHVQFDVVGTFAVAVAAVAFFAVFGLVALHETVFHQGVDVFVGHGPHAAAFAAVAAVGAAAGHEFFTAEAHGTVAAFARHHFDFGFVDKFHSVLK